jgi:hypothetical protein
MEKEPKPKKEKVVKPVTLVSYSIKMVIPTGNYANIQPEIVVKSGSLEEAHAFIAPHMNKLWKEYYLVGERRPEPVKPPEVVANQPPTSSVALVKATNAIQSCTSLEALDLIKKQIEVSTKLTPEDKVAVAPLLEAKLKGLNGKNV